MMAVFGDSCATQGFYLQIPTQACWKLWFLAGNWKFDV
jgi:hypothetical protein